MVCGEFFQLLWDENGGRTGEVMLLLVKNYVGQSGGCEMGLVDVPVALWSNMSPY